MTKRTVTVPTYFKDLPDDANLNSRDVAAIFGYSSNKQLTHAYRAGHMPEPDYRPYYSGVRLFWKVKTIREWIENDHTKPTK